MLTGDGVAGWADTLAINAVATMKPMQARYNIFCNERGRNARRHDLLPARRTLAAGGQRLQRRQDVGAPQRAPSGRRRAAGEQARRAGADRDSRSASAAMLQPHVDADVSA